MQLDSSKYQSRVLMGWLSGRDGGADRAGVGIKAMFPENSTASNLSADELARLLGAASTSISGAPVTAETAFRVTAVYGCVSLISGAISTLPLPIYERTDADSRKKAEHDYWWMLNEQASENWGAAVAFEYFVSAKCFYGDSFGEILRP